MISDPTPRTSAVVPATNADTIVDWRRLHPWSILTIAIRYLRGLVVPVGIVIVSRGFSGGRSDLIFNFGLPLVVAAGAIALGFLHWTRFRYAVSEHDLVIRSGLISREERIIPLARIQSVDFEEPPIERILRLTRVRIETAATGHDDAKIVFHSLGQDDAQTFRQELLRARQHSVVDAQETASPVLAGTASSHAMAQPLLADESELIRKLSTRELLFAGATSGRIGPAAAVVGILSQFANEYMPKSWWSHVPWRDAISGNAGVIAGLVLTFGVIVWLLAIGSMVLTHAGFELRRAGDQLTIQHGLLERRRSTIPLRRIQAIVLLEGLFRQPFGYGELKFESAGQAGGDDGRSGVLFPFLPMRDMESLIARITPEYALEIAPEAVHRLPSRALQRYVIPGISWTVIFGIVVNAACWKWLDGGIQWWTLGLFALVPIVTCIRWARYRAAGWFVSPVHLMMRWRTTTGRVTMVTRVQRLQHRALTANLFQRRAHLATFWASVASGSSGGHFALPQVDRADAEHLLWQLNRRNARDAAADAVMEAAASTPEKPPTPRPT